MVIRVGGLVTVILAVVLVVVIVAVVFDWAYLDCAKFYVRLLLLWVSLLPWYLLPLVKPTRLPTYRSERCMKLKMIYLVGSFGGNNFLKLQIPRLNV